MSRGSAPRPMPRHVPVEERRRPITPEQRPDVHINILCASMAIGGAERIVHDVVTALEQSEVAGKLFVLHDVRPSYALPGGARIRTVPLQQFELGRRLPAVALEVLASPSRVLITHLIRAADLRRLWGHGVMTVPVIHNSAPGWHDPPEVYDDPHVPFVIAVSASVAAQLREARCPKPVVVLRHELPRSTVSADEQLARRARIRAQYGIRDDQFLIGMVGQFKAHKAYTRAVRVLHRLQRHMRAKLMIVGGWDHAYGAGRVTYTATMRRGIETGVLPDVIIAGSVDPVEPYYAAFDVLLNTSIYEGMSIATLEAVRAGCPVVTADVGGQREAIAVTDEWIADPADIDAYVAALRRVSVRGERILTIDEMPWPNLNARLWAWLARYGAAESAGPRARAAETLFVTSNMNPGGAQRSLANLLCALDRERHRSLLCILDRVYDGSFLRQLEAAGVPVLSLSGVAATLDRAGRLLDLISRLGVRNVCFWNADPAIKILLAKVHEATDLRLIDVSPGPMLFRELEDHHVLQRRACLSAAEYVRRLDRFVAKYEGGQPPSSYGADPARISVIPNGVPPLWTRASAGQPVAVRPDSVDPDFALVTCTRIAPNKCVELLLEMMAELAELEPRASLTVVGGVDARHAEYWHAIEEKLAARAPVNVHFAGPRSNVEGFLDQFKVFVMFSRAQGCPNASLEAMAMGLPVVANDDGGTCEQVIHGQTGFLVADDDVREMARYVARLLRDPAEARRLGGAGRALVQTRFSMERMLEGHLAVLEGTC